MTVLDECLHPEYRDDDIGSGEVDHIQNSKDYLADLFRRVPTIGVEVRGAVVVDDVISAHIEWFDRETGHRSVRMKGIGIFVMRGNRIITRHTYLYYRRGAAEA